MDPFVEIGHQLEQNSQIRLRSVKLENAVLHPLVGDGRQGDVSFAQFTRALILFCHSYLRLDLDSGFANRVRQCLDAAVIHESAAIRMCVPRPSGGMHDKSFLMQIRIDFPHFFDTQSIVLRVGLAAKIKMLHQLFA